MVEVVVLPSLPVMAMMRHGQRLQNASISEVRIAPFCAAARSCGTMGSTPGVRKMTSKSKCSR